MENLILLGNSETFEIVFTKACLAGFSHFEQSSVTVVRTTLVL
ncbi:MAG TPA: hypothetical protein VNO31_11940 [Umezawaea sp.]|nr:hypothetical protein [Umezawaea sp.]